MMEAITTHLLKTIPFEPDLAALKKRLRLKENTEGLEEFNQLLDLAISIARPRAFYLVAYITGRGEDWIEISDRCFSSRVLRVNTEQAYRVFPYLATCGEELQHWAEGIDDVVHQFWAEAIKEAALFSALSALGTAMHDLYLPGHTASMSPGSLQDWPIQQQRILFDLFDGANVEIKVLLTDSMLMIPTKSVSGIRFPTEAAFESCQLCPREACPGRRAPYDADLYQNRYCSQHDG